MCILKSKKKKPEENMKRKYFHNKPTNQFRRRHLWTKKFSKTLALFSKLIIQ